MREKGEFIDFKKIILFLGPIFHLFYAECG